MSNSFKKFDLNNFWKKSVYAIKKYVGDKLTSQMVQTIEKEIGYKLPAFYIALLKTQNGGIPRNTNYPITKPTSWAKDHVAINGIMGIDRRKPYSLLGNLGSEFMKSEWGYPDIGIYVCDCPSAGHDMIALDYRKCGENGEPEVVHVDQEFDYKITFLSSNFEDFVKGLVPEDAFDIPAVKDVRHLWKPADISFKLKEANNQSKTRAMIELNQKLASGETGWSQSRFYVPKNWKNATIEMQHGRIHILVNAKNYYIGKENSGKLIFEILSAGNITDAKLEEIWNKFAGD